MCLGIPGRVVEMVEGYANQLALVDVEGAQHKINIGMLEDQHLAPGDWVLIHMGFAVERIDDTGAEQAMAGLEMIGRPRDGGRDLHPVDGPQVQHPGTEAADVATLHGERLPHA